VATPNAARPPRRVARAAGRIVLLLGFLAGLSPGFFAVRSARADALQVQFSTRVAAGERPKIVLTARQTVGPIDVSLRDETGKTVSAHIPRLAAGAQHQVPLSDAPGRHRYEGEITITRGDAPPERRPINFETVVAPRLEVTVDRGRVDLSARRLEARLSRPPERVEVQVTRVPREGNPPEIVTAEQDLRGQAAGATLTINWPAFAGTAAEQPAAEIARIDLKFVDVDGFFTGVALLPWQVSIPHEEVNFATGLATIDMKEHPKLETSFSEIAEALARHRTLGPVKLYIAGHTDTVGSPQHNLGLSQARALSIARWFRRRGLRLPIAYEGFGEGALLVPTPDETPEVRNRRVDYILALEDPLVKQRGGRVAWKRLP
jgi:outer membrane protein OmpA-like peptidoglycan-associated protein